ncbi:energy-coupling factor transport system ATP-binding protein [Rossellomorea aquimaris]|uniref:Energy-coupling factor transport system ATP-binding protein n=2 Tax=Rossellomorea aquimaris TaxID=189382 RepID=A0A366F045_9BACI|nr:energy-coupling factor transport system ATP-binding protein [Rossellomorea aquimaris]
MHVENLRLTFSGSDKLMFKDVSLTIEDGEKVLLLGPSGCGKSTLLQVLSGVIPHLIDVPMKANSIERPESFGYVFQDPDAQFCMPYVDEEIAFVLENNQIPRDEMPGEIKELLEKVNLSLGDSHTKISSLSGGMKQKLAIASALALHPHTLFLDEPTAMLDEESTKSVWETVKTTCEDKTLLIVEHKLSHVLEIIDRIILFDANGRIVADGPKAHILSNFKETLKLVGVWYPEAWNDYLSSHPPQKVAQFGETNLKLENFKGYIQKEVKIHVENAVILKGEWIAITGKNGAGKSTLLHSLMKFIQTTGTYELYGSQVKGKNVPEECTFVFQNPEFQFVTNSVFDEVAYTFRRGKVDEGIVEKKVHALLKRFKLDSYNHHHPYHLSMGQKRRLSVAASLVRNKDILLLDEPTFGQDSQNTFALLEMLRDYQKEGSTILMVTHDEKIITHFASRVWVIENGRLTQDFYNEIAGSKAI